MRNEKTVVVFGAGADCGIFPMTNHLVASINYFLEHDEAGIQADRMLKKTLGLKHYCYASILDEVAYRFVQKTDLERIGGIRRRLNSLSPTPPEKSMCDFIFALCDQMCGRPKKIREKERVLEHPELLRLLENAGMEKIVTVCPETTVNAFLLKSFRAMLRAYLENPGNRVLHQLFKSMVRFDAILLELFLGFYNGNQADIRRYMYVSWTMWAFFVHTEQQYLLKNNENPCVYTKIEEYPAITLNYTTLADRFTGKKGSVLHFHGSALSYIDCGSREEITLPSFATGRCIAPEPPMLEVLENDVLPLLHPDWRLSIIPSMIPPFEIKPIIASDTIETWHRAVELLEQSAKIVVIGYSFNHVDSHFNDNIIKWAGVPGKSVFIVNPDVNSITAYFDACPGLSCCRNEPWKKTAAAGTDITCLKKGNITIIPGTTRDILGMIGRHIDVAELGFPG